ncbi:MAG: sulfotransferase family 2 domain-containing protein [Pseudomonadota bacterium]
MKRVLGRLRASGRPKVHFLHIGKTGGSAIRGALRDCRLAGAYELMLHSHGVSLSDVPVGEKVTFFLRDPVSRFISGFYSRKRKGQPRYQSEWNELEAEVFTAFDTPNSLAEALGDGDHQHHELAHQAMEQIQHLGHYSQWLVSMEYLQSRASDVFFVGYQDSLSRDFEALKSKLNLGSDVVLPDDDVGAHRNPKGLDKSLSESARATLEAWFAEDQAMLDYCRRSFT